MCLKKEAEEKKSQARVKEVAEVRDRISQSKAVGTELVSLCEFLKRYLRTVVARFTHI